MLVAVTAGETQDGRLGGPGRRNIVETVYKRWGVPLGLTWVLLAALFLGRGGTRVVAAPAALPSSRPPAIVITQPGPRETTLGEKRDFYVKGAFGSGVHRTGDLRIDLFRVGADGREGKRVRSMRSHVGATGVTLRSSLQWAWKGGILSPEGCLLLPPDLVMGPRGADPDHKVVVRERDWAALVLGGATWLPEIDGPDVRGTRLADLTRGPYRLVVSGLSGDLQGQVARLDLRFGPSPNLFGRFSPPPHMDRMKRYAGQRGLRLYLDDLPGYFTGKEGHYQVLAREYPNNSLEAVNTLPGIVDARPALHENHVLIWNVHEGSVTQKVEIGAIVRHGLVESVRTEWLHYDLGEYEIDSPERAQGESRHHEATIVPFAPGRRLQMTRAEVRRRTAQGEDGVYVTSDATPRRVVPDLSCPVVVGRDEKLALFGVTRPLVSETTPGPEPATWKTTNRVARVRYRVRDGNLRLVGDSLRDVRLRRTTVDGKTVEATYEYRHEMDFGTRRGTYRVEYVGIDVAGQEVPGTGGIVSISQD